MRLRKIKRWRRLLALLLFVMLGTQLPAGYAVGAEPADEQQGTNIRDYLAPGETLLADRIESGSETYYTKITYSDSNGVQIPDGEAVPVDAWIHMKYAFQIPNDLLDDLQPGDYYVLEISEQVSVTLNQPIILADSLGNEYASVDVSGGNIVLTLTRNIETQDTWGYFEISGMFDQDQIDNPGDLEIIYNEDIVEGGKVVIRPVDGSAIEKGFEGDDVLYNTKEISWYIDINKSMNKVAEPVVKDVIPEELLPDENSIKVYRLAVNMSGEVTAVSNTEETGWSIYCENNILSVSYPGEITEAYRIVYTTLVKESAMAAAAEGDGKLSLKNEASLSYSSSDSNAEEKLTAEASLTASYGIILGKQMRSSSQAEMNQGIYHAEIMYNYNESTVAAGTVLRDYVMQGATNVSNGFRVTDVKVYAITLDENGKETGRAELDDNAYEIDGDADDTLFTMKFLQDVSGAVLIAYDFTSTGEVQGNGSYTNYAAVDETKYESGGGFTYYQRIGSKSALSIDEAKKEITWYMWLNRNGYELTELQIEDTLSGNQKFIKDSFAVYRTKKAVDTDGKWTGEWNLNGEADNWELANVVDKSFSMAFENPGDTAYYVTYKTSYDTAYQSDLNSSGQFYNAAAVKWATSSRSYQTNIYAYTTPSVIVKQNGWKKGSYNAQTKRITWDVGLNYNNISYDHAEFEDIVEYPQQIVADSIAIYKYATSGNMQAQLLSEEELKERGIEVEADDTRLYVSFADVSAGDHYNIVFETELTGEVRQEEYENEASFTYDETEDILTAEVGVSHGGEHMFKTGSQGTSTDGYGVWTLWINRAQSVLKNVKVVDVISSNQAFMEDAVQIHGTRTEISGDISVDNNHLLIKDVDYTLEFKTVTEYDDAGEPEDQHQEMVIEFIGTYAEIDRPYQISYQTLVNGSVGDELYNEATVYADGEEIPGGGQKEKIKISSADGKGFVSGKKRFLGLQKTDEDGIPLEGVKLYVKGGTLTDGIFTTDENGRIYMYDYLDVEEEYTFIITEIEAQEGCIIPENLKLGVEVTIYVAEEGIRIVKCSDESLISKEGVVVNKPVEVSIQKKDREGDLLAGAQFKIQKYDEEWNVWLDREDIDVQSDGNGTFTVQKLMAGRYRFVEVSAPGGYLLNTETEEFFIYYEDGQTIAEVQSLELINYKGAAFLKKTDGTQVLEGAEFSLYKEENDGTEELWYEGLISDEEGMVEAGELAPGSYYFVETKAPEGYVLNTEKVYFIIEESAAGEPETVDAGELVNRKEESSVPPPEESGDPPPEESVDPPSKEDVDPPSEEPGDLGDAKTGDVQNILIWCLGVLAAGIAVFAIARKKRNR